MAADLYSLPSLPCSLPTIDDPNKLDLASVALQTQIILSQLKQDDFVIDAIWRDSFALTGTLRTFYSAAAVFRAWTETSATHRPKTFAVPTAQPRVTRVAAAVWLEVPFTFETTGIPATTCSGFASMTLHDGRWKIWVLRTILEGLEGEPDVDVLEPVPRPNEITTNGATTNGHGKNSSKTPDYYGCAIIGGGQAGLSVGGRLQALGVSYVILDKHEEIGDNWKTRYDSTKRMPP
ncbi:uncharacterized protein N0V89_011327 [Didymosphaeria variabile]|uniref:FAD/NAD(P)-binding domain-containing protein n=1 Tax=Didymosphaeria variabile TaxID=1932322 RepID=A0A9W9C6B4_9PLEO|nr:uncharacterized protein N0V89_011327 [Didymosphaeria variabile]KAJ4345198.1 hypothetical protein N0V89_011327 [Didymosphaeria variabile]